MKRLVSTYVVEEPNQRDEEQTEAVEFEDQAVGCLAAHRVLVKVLGFLELEAEVQQDEGEDDADAEGGAPDDFVIGRAGSDDDCSNVSGLSTATLSRGICLQGIKAPMTKPPLIMVLVNRMNQRWRVPGLSSLVDSAAPTLPAGYSPVKSQPLFSSFPCASRAGGTVNVPPIPIPTKNRQAVRMLNMPSASPFQ